MSQTNIKNFKTRASGKYKGYTEANAQWFERLESYVTGKPISQIRQEDKLVDEITERR